MSKPKIPLTHRDWFRYHLVVLGKSPAEIAREVGVPSLKVLKKLCSALGESLEDPLELADNPELLKFLYISCSLSWSNLGYVLGVSSSTARDRLLQAGIRLRPLAEARLRKPSYGERRLAKYFYETCKMTLRETGEELQRSYETVRKVLQEEGVVLRRKTRKPSRYLRRRILLAAGVSEVCLWCDAPDSGCYLDSDKVRHLHIHHRDHEPANDRPENLQFMCHQCHQLETWTWVTRDLGKVELPALDHPKSIDLPLRIEFPKRLGNISWLVTPDSPRLPSRTAASYRARARNVLRDTRRPRQCIWCGLQKAEGVLGLHAHHINHDVADCRPENLVYLCYHCHRLETWLWSAQSRGVFLVEVNNNQSGLNVTPVRKQ